MLPTIVLIFKATDYATLHPGLCYFSVPRWLQGSVIVALEWSTTGILCPTTRVLLSGTQWGAALFPMFLNIQHCCVVYEDLPGNLKLACKIDVFLFQPCKTFAVIQWSFGYMAIQLYGRSSQNLDVNLLSVIWPFSYMAGHITAI